MTVALDLVSTDVVHAWFVPALTGKAEAVPGKTNQSSSAPTRKGCSTGFVDPHGPGIRELCRPRSTWSPPTSTRAFVETQKADIQAAQDPVEDEIEHE